MKIVVFLGPSLTMQSAQAILPTAIYKPPIECGDIIECLHQDSPDCIAIIDGLFYQQVSVWHKEILLALSHKIRVYGAASMGALRAAELSEFGMQGIGKIYQWYQNNVIEGDDEVALLHDLKSYQSLTIPLVNIRASLNFLLTENLVSEEQLQAIFELANTIHFSKRTRAELTQKLLVSNYRSLVGNKLDLLFEHYIDQKALDAKELLMTIQRHDSQKVLPTFQLMNTVFLQKLRASVENKTVSEYINSLENTLNQSYATSTVAKNDYLQYINALVENTITTDDKIQLANMVSRIDAICIAKNIILSQQGLAFYRTKLFQEKNLGDEKSLQRWLNQYHINQSDLDTIVLLYFYITHYIHSNNTHELIN
ncbi:MAG: hypothetical protein KIT27_05465 [Legionellales bacterium]|nr:hypothetical protein [Legionellales bacterium]